ncbi:MAG: photosystem II protein PsbQ [Thermosynechococcaceae cyanobacterium MS004]|nr:photosystem II protein PsbQ [Thermosynechococcaceae cyanobacterium MS004]
MFRFRALISLLLTIVAVVLVSCGGPSAVSAPPVYTDAQLERIQQYLPEIQSAYQRFDALNDSIQARNWQDIRSTIRGPFGSLIENLKYVTSNLLPEEQKAAREISRDIFQDFIGIDQAATNKNVDAALQSFDSAVRDVEKFLAKLPELPGGDELTSEVESAT